MPFGKSSGGSSSGKTMTNQHPTYHFCTVTTRDHLYKVFALRDSLLAIDERFLLHVLVTDGGGSPADASHLAYYSLSQITHATAPALHKKYAGNRDKLRWVFKPMLMRWLLDTHERLIYLDNDMACFEAYDFLFDELDAHVMLLTPHHYPRDPGQDQQWLEANYKVGLYNAGFIAANHEAKDLLDWWAQCCLYRCEKNSLRGLFDDQKYLDLLPIMDHRVKVLRHKGCNVAGWNREVCRRVEVNGQVLIGGTDPVVFIHFNRFTLCHIPADDPLLVRHYELYHHWIMRYNSQWKKPLSSDSWFDRLKLALWKWLNTINQNSTKHG